MMTSVAREFTAYTVPTSEPLRPRPLSESVSQIWKNDHQIPHDAKKSSSVSEL